MLAKILIVLSVGLGVTQPKPMIYDGDNKEYEGLINPYETPEGSMHYESPQPELLLPINYDDNMIETEDSENSTDRGNSTAKDLYVIRTIVYEIGILTEADSNETDTDVQDRHEQIDLSFFDPNHNGSTVDLSNIPVPLQTNISGQIITGVAPVNFGSITIPTGSNSGPLVLPSVPNANGDDGFNQPITIPNAVVSIRHNVSISNTTAGSKFLKALSPLFGVPPVSEIDSLFTDED